MTWLLRQHPINKHKAVAAGGIELLLAHICAAAPAGGAALSTFEPAWVVLLYLVVGTGHETRAVLAGVLEALEARGAVASPAAETARLDIIRRLQPAAQRHDGEPCAVDGCMRCAAARISGIMCALPGCGARVRDGAAAKKLLRCGTCRAACYCGAAHQRADWGRHKGACSEPQRDDDDQAAAGASGS
jgi:hypothetical protein